VKNFPWAKMFACLLYFIFSSANAQVDYPKKPITIIVPYAVGGGADQVARLMGQQLSLRLKQSVVIENRGGGSNTIGMNFVAKSAPDGYVLGLATPTFLMTPSIIKNHPYDPLTDFTGVAIFSDAPLVLAVNPKLPVKNVKELIDYGKAHPNELNWASGGTASTQGLAGVLFGMTAGIQTTQVQYKGSSQGLNDLLGGSVQFMFNPMPSIIQHERSGKLRILGVAGSQKMTKYPEFALIQDAIPGFRASGWFGFVAPKGTPTAVLDLLHKEVNEIVKDPTIRERLIEEGLEPKSISREAFNKDMQSEFAKYQKILSTQNIVKE
jgi:tripartite-type tricarboxylate transporter receptor subunit TctC